MSAGRWFRCDLSAWDTLIEQVRADGKPLSVAVASMDLRRHAHDPKSERAYARRWVWHHSRARRLIKGGDWIDPWKQGETQPQKPAKQAHSRTAAAAQQKRSTAPTSNADNGPTHTAGTQQAHSGGTAEKKHRNYNVLISKINNTCRSESKELDPFDQAVNLWKQHKPKGAGIASALALVVWFAVAPCSALLKRQRAALVVAVVDPFATVCALFLACF